jgi:iron complex transport system ATP-binding protein
MASLLDCEGLTIGVGDRLLVDRLTLTLSPGALVAILGPNGVGKTLTLHTLAALRPRRDGIIRLRGEEPHALARREIALRLGLLLQQQADPFPTTVLETALMGRYARLGLWQWETAEDLERARGALQAMDLAGLETRPAASLSGGERRRLALATLLVQDPDVLLLDEPMNHLDPLHQFSVLETLRALAHDGRAVVASLHDPTLAARYFDTVLLLYGDGRWQAGAAGELLDPTHLAGLYRVPFARFSGSSGSVVLPAPAAPRRLTLPKIRR